MMTRVRFSLLGLVFFLMSLTSEAQYVAIPDANFRAFLETNYPTCMSGGMLNTTCTQVLTATALNVSDKNIVNLSGVEYFVSLKGLYCFNNQLSVLPTLPSTLTYLSCYNNLLTVLPTLPSTLTHLTCAGNKLTALPTLPSSLIWLDCLINKLIVLPTLPISLTTLKCSENLLPVLPVLPSSLTQLECSNNKLTVLPALPSSLAIINCSENSLTILPALPSSLNFLVCDNNQLSALPSLPSSLTWLSCLINKVIVLPTLPSLLTYLNCSGNLLTTLPSLPSSLTTLKCNYNKLTVLPTLESSLSLLECNNNQLTTLPTLPSLLNFLACDNNQLAALPSLPSSLDGLRCNNNQLTVLPLLPNLLTYLNCSNNALSCLPLLPNSLISLTSADNSIACLPNIPTAPNFWSDQNINVCNTISNVNECYSYPLISGRVFIDDDASGLYDFTENGYVNAKVEIQPGNYILTTDMNGYYAANVDIGTYTIQVEATTYPYYTILPAIHNVTFNTLGQTSTANNFAMQANAAINDLSVTLTPNGMARPGRGVVYTVTYSNKGTTTLTGEVQLEYDAALTIDSTSAAVTTQSSTVLTWDYIDLKPGQSKNINVYCTAATTVQNGDILQLIATVNPIVGDEVVLDNVDALSHVVTTSYDPNFKEVTPAADITPAQVASQENFTYTVHFQNTGSDTAFVVIIKDTISTNFEIQEIQTLASSHPCTMNMKNGAAAWIFNEILLPDSTTNEPASHGFVKYRIIPKNSLVLGDEIKNTAHIFFDYNEPVETNTTVNRVAINLAVQDASSGNNLLLYPNPTKGFVTLSVESKGAGMIRISNTEGVLIQQLDGVDFSNELSLDLSYQVKGIYIIQVIANDGVMTKKVVVN